MDTEEEIIKAIKKLILHNKFTNDMYWQERALDNIKYQKALDILLEDD